MFSLGLKVEDVGDYTDSWLARVEGLGLLLVGLQLHTRSLKSQCDMD